MAEPNAKIDLSIIIVNWNTLALLRDCLRSLPSGVRRYSHEVFVVDNGSTDGSQEMVRNEFPAVRLIENGRNLGFAAANNRALRQASGDFFLLLNSDTVMIEDAADILIDYMRENPRAGFCSPQLLNADGSRQNSIANFPTLLTELGHRGLLRKICPHRFYAKQFVADSPMVVESLVGAALLARRAMTDQIGFYDEDFFFFFEETEWCRRAGRAGWECVLVPQSHLYHLQGQSAKQAPLAVRIEYWRSRYTYFRKQGSLVVRAMLVTGLLSKSLGNLLINTLCAPFSPCSRYRSRLYLTILLWHLRGLPAEMGLAPVLPSKHS